MVRSVCSSFLPKLRIRLLNFEEIASLFSFFKFLTVQKHNNTYTLTLKFFLERWQTFGEKMAWQIHYFLNGELVLKTINQRIRIFPTLFFNSPDYSFKRLPVFLGRVSILLFHFSL